MLLLALKVIVLGVGGITLTEEQFEKLQTIEQDISELVRHEIITQDTSGNNGDRDSDNELMSKFDAHTQYQQTRVAADKLEHMPGSMTFFKH